MIKVDLPFLLLLSYLDIRQPMVYNINQIKIFYGITIILMLLVV